MPGRRLKTKEREEHLAQVSALYLQRVPQHEIARRMGYSEAQISRDVAILQQRWMRSSAEDFALLRAEQLAEINHLLGVYWERYVASLAPLERSSVQERVEQPQLRAVNGQTVVGPSTTTTTTGLTKAETRGDPRWLEGVRWCIDRKIKLLGLDEPERFEINGDNPISLAALHDVVSRAQALGFLDAQYRLTPDFIDIGGGAPALDE